jgi:hypothetical protein
MKYFLRFTKRRRTGRNFKIHIQEFRPNSWELFDYLLAKSSESCSGAEIRQSIIEGMYHAFMRNENSQLMMSV